MNRWLIPFCAFLVFISACKDNAHKIDLLAEKCTAGDHEACKELANIVTSNEDQKMCEMAVDKLTNISELARIALDGNSPTSLFAIRKLASEESLIKNDKGNIDKNVRLIQKFLSAFDSVPGKHLQRIILEIFPVIQALSYPAINSEVGDVIAVKTEWAGKSKDYSNLVGNAVGTMKGEYFSCSIKVQKLPEPLSHSWSTDFPSSSASLDFLPAEIKPDELLKELFSKITNSALLADIARNDKLGFIHPYAIEKLTDQSVLEDIAKNSNEKEDRMVAVIKLTDRSLLEDIARNDKEDTVRHVAEIRLKELMSK